MGWEGIGTAIGVVASWFSPKQRVRRLKDELDKLQKEKSALLITKANINRAKRLVVINDRIAELQRLLKNTTTD